MQPERKLPRKKAPVPQRRSERLMHVHRCLLPPALLTLLAPWQVLRRAKTGLLAAHRGWGVVTGDAGMGLCWISLLFPQG